MPHIILEYTNNIAQPVEAGTFFPGVHAVLEEVGKIPVRNCKSRLLRTETYWLGHGDPKEAFAHLDIRFMEGRSKQVKQAIGYRCLSLLKKYFEPTIALLDLQMTVEVRDIVRAFYFKLPEGTFLDPA